METNKKEQELRGDLPGAQSAVDWLYNQMQQMQYFIGNDLYYAIKEAKAKERKQIETAYYQGQESKFIGGPPPHSLFCEESFTQ